MFHFTSHKLLFITTLSLALFSTAVGGFGWFLLRCDMLDYLNRAAPAPLNAHERYLFACGNVWHSTDGGHIWERVTARGLPLGARDGHIAADRQPGFLYLGVLIQSQSSVYCWQCAWTKLRPAIYVSIDGGRTWAFSYKFKRGSAGEGGFLGLFADPDRDGAAYAVIKNSDEIAYYGTGTAGQFWKELCTEYYFAGSGACDLPKNVLRFQDANQIESGTVIGK